MDPVLENVLVEVLVELPADADVPIVASAPERTWIWSDLHLSDPSVLLGWGRPFRSVEEMNRHLLRNWRRRVGADDTIICLGDVGHPDAWWDDGTWSVGVEAAHAPEIRHPRQQRRRHRLGTVAREDRAHALRSLSRRAHSRGRSSTKALGAASTGRDRVMVQCVTVPPAFDFRSWWDSSAWATPEISQHRRPVVHNEGLRRHHFWAPIDGALSDIRAERGSSGTGSPSAAKTGLRRVCSH